MGKYVVILFAVLLALSGCKREKTAKETVRTVKTSFAAVYGEKKTSTYPGRVKASSEVNLSFRISGPVAKINVKGGQFVRKGQTMAEMDTRDYLVQLSATEAEYRQVKAEAERVIGLYEKQSVAENDYDKAVSALTQITAKYEAHRNALSDTRLTAPFDGYVQKCYYERAETVGAGMPVFSFIGAGLPEVEINIPASEYILRDRFDSFSCSLDIYPGCTFPLEMISVNHKANLNQLYTVRFGLKDGGGCPQLPSPGMSTMVTVYFRHEDANLTSIPLTALMDNDGATAVWIYSEADATVNARRIKVYEIRTDGTVVVSDGLEAGEEVVSAGVGSLTEGERVRLLPKASTTNEGGLL